MIEEGRGRNEKGAGSQPRYLPPRTATAWSPTRRRNPPLIDDQTWQRVQERIARHRRLPSQASGRYLLTGLLRCPKCGRRTSGWNRANHRQQPQYRCVGTVSGDCSFTVTASTVDRAALDEVVAVVGVVAPTDTRLRAAIRAAWDRLRAPGEGEDIQRQFRALQREAERARERLMRAALLFVDGQIDKAGYDAARSQAERDLEASEAELADLRGADPVQPDLPGLDVVLRQAGGWQAVLAGADTAARRDVLAPLVETVTPERVGWGKYEAKITWTPLGEALARLAEGGTLEPNSEIS